MKFRMIDLCAGIGGIRRGFELAERFENVLSAEVDEQACLTYENLYGDNPRNDLTTREFKDKVASTQYDVLLAGFPCQAFSGVGLQEGFRDKIKGTIFFDIAEIIDETRPKVVFLENVRNLISHDKGRTFRTIIDILENSLNYKVVGVQRKDGEIYDASKSFVRNTRDFGLPQNRPRVYITCFSRDYFGDLVDRLPNVLPQKIDSKIFNSVNDVLDFDVDGRYFLSSGYLATLENHAVKQAEKGYGFGFNIVNRDGEKNPIAMTLLATGGSGKERNLVIDERNGRIWAGMTSSHKKTPINDRCVRMMTPSEWGRLQGFIGYAFVDDQGTDRFSFPEGMTDSARYKQFGNSVSIPVIQAMAGFVLSCLDAMKSKMSPIEQQIVLLDPVSVRIYRAIEKRAGKCLNKKSRTHCVALLKEFGSRRPFSFDDARRVVRLSPPGTAFLLRRLIGVGCMRREKRGLYAFSPLTEHVVKQSFGPVVDWVQEG